MYGIRALSEHSKVDSCLEQLSEIQPVNGCISVKTSPINTKHGDFFNLSVVSLTYVDQ